MGTRWQARLERTLTPVGAIRGVALVTALVTIVSGALIHLVDRREFPTLGRALWWAIQTVTSVGYGDAVPEAVAGRVVAVFVMITGIAFLTVAVAAISARLVGREHRRTGVEETLTEIAERLERLEALLHDRRAA